VKERIKKKKKKRSFY